MAVTARFQADFESFYNAVQKAQVQLRSFEGDAGKVEKALSRMTDNFTGRKIIQEATLMAAAVEKAGGASKLTAQELESVSSRAQEAAAKLGKLGAEVPKNLQALADAGPQASGALGLIEGAAVKVGAALTAAFAVDRIVGFVGSLAPAARELRNLSIETGVSTSELQVLGAVTGDLGVDSAQLGKAMGNLALRISGGDDSAAGAVHRLGLSFGELSGLKPDELFLKIARSIDALPDQFSKISAAGDLFGDRIGSAVVKVSHNIDQAVAEARRLTVVASEEAIKQAAAFDDSWSRLGTSAKAASINIFGPLMKGTADWLDILSKSQSKFELFVNALGGGSWKKGLADAAAALEPPKMAVSHGPGAGPVAAPTADEIFSKIQLDALKALTAEQQHFLEQLYDMGVATKENAAAFGVSATQLDAFKKKEEEIIQTQALLSTNLMEGAKLYASLEAAGAKATDTLNEKTATWLENMERSIQRLRELGQAAGEALTNRGAQAPGGFDQALNTRNATIDQINSQERLHPGLTTPGGDDVFATLRAKAFADFDDAIAKLNKGATAATMGFVQVAQAGDGLSNSLAQFSQTIAGTIPNVNVQTGEGTANTDPRLLNYLSQGYTMGEALAIVSGAGGALGRPQRRAGGGAVSAGSPYWVGEKGPELFVPSASGGIVPNGGGGHTITVNVSGLMLSNDPRAREDLKRTVDDAVMAALRRSGQKMSTV
jgi:hypothetical protein